MKNKYFSFVALAAAALATSCASDDLAEQKQEQNQNGTRTVTLTASVNEVQTRVGMTKNTDGTTASFYWHKDDAISVLTMSKSFVKFTTTNADGTQKATFTGEVATGTTVSKYAIYPYNENNVFNGSQITCYLSAEFDYDKVESNIFSKTENGNTTYPANPTNIPMLGTISNNSISFKCMGGLAVIRIDKMPAEKGTLAVSADQQLSGKFSINYSTPSISTTSTNVSDTDKKVTFNFSNAQEGKIGVFYLPLATGTYTNLKIVIAYGENNATTQTIPYGSLTVERAHVTAIPLSTDSNNNLRYIVKNSDGTYTVNGHKFVDLGLSSGLLWATMNVGAESEIDIGGFFAWGETTTKDKYNWSTYKYGTSDNNLTKYTGSDGKTVLEAEDDAATANWGSSCRMPTTDEFKELVSSDNNNCETTWDGTKNGYTITGKKSGYTSNSIFLPATKGRRNDESSSTTSDDQGVYWSNSYYNNTHSYTLYFTSTNKPFSGASSYVLRYQGLAVRAVAPKPTTTE